MVLPPFEYSRISPCLLAGRDPLTADDVALLFAEGVTHVLDLREPSEWHPPRLGEEALTEMERLGLIRYHVEIEDGGAPGAEDFERCLAFLEGALSSNPAQVYVHCRAGMERTAVILIAWYARKEGFSYYETLRQLQAKRPVLHPLPCQEEAIHCWLASADSVGLTS